MPKLIPVRYEGIDSPFTFLYGRPPSSASDLADTPVYGPLEVRAYGNCDP